jgi:hypothetical protein
MGHVLKESHAVEEPTAWETRPQQLQSYTQKIDTTLQARALRR